jgi:flagellar biosynthesis protein FliP
VLNEWRRGITQFVHKRTQHTLVPVTNHGQRSLTDAMKTRTPLTSFLAAATFARRLISLTKLSKYPCNKKKACQNLRCAPAFAISEWRESFAMASALKI